jgi:F-box protein 21
MLPQLPFDILVCIFRSVPAERLDDEGISALFCCLQVNHPFYDACMDPSVWKAHYHCRYTLFEQKAEIERRELFGITGELYMLREGGLTEWHLVIYRT